MPVDDTRNRASVASLLRDVSRSFYLTVRVLPGRVRAPIGLAYLLARATDTIADTAAVDVPHRIDALGRLSAAIQGAATGAGDLRAFREGGAGATDGEQRLLARLDEVLALLGDTPTEDRDAIRSVLATIASGQELDLRRFGHAMPGAIRALDTDADLDDYTYRVAGCVGEFWTRVCLHHLLDATRLDVARLRADGVRYGQGLQLVNILRDLPRDLRDGRCYLPSERLAAAGLSPAALLDPARRADVRPLYDAYLDRAASLLADGWAYTNALPRAQVRLRLACAWPALIGLETLAALRATPALEAARRVKVSRSAVRAVMARSILLYPWAGAWSRMGPSDARIHP